MHRFWRQCAVMVLALSVGACGSPKPGPVSGPWDIVLLDGKTGKQTGRTIRQNNYLVAYAVSAEVNAVVTSCRKASPDSQVRERRSRDGKSGETRTGILRVWDIASGKLLAEREDGQTLHSSVWVPPSGKTFITATVRNPAQDTLAKHRLVLWDYSSGQIQEVALFEMAPRSNFAVTFTPDGQSVVICGDLLVSVLDKADVSQAASGRPLHPPVTDLRSLQATFAEDSESVFTLTQPEQGTWRLRLFDSAGNEKWTVDSYKNARFLASVTHRDSPISFAVFPPQADPIRK